MEPKGKPTTAVMGEPFDVCKFVGPNYVLKREEEIKGINIDVTGDGIADSVMARTETTYRCKGKGDPDTTKLLLMRPGESKEKVPLSIKNAKGKSFKLGDVVTVGNSDYVLVGIPPQPIIFDGDKIGRDDLVVLLFSVDTLEKIRRTGSVDEEIKKLVQETTIAVRLEKIASSRPLSIYKNTSDYEGILGSFLNGPYAPLMQSAADVAMNALFESEGEKWKHSMEPKGKSAAAAMGEPFDICGFFSPDKVIKSEKEIRGIKIDVTGDGIADYVMARTETIYRCKGKDDPDPAKLLLMKPGEGKKNTPLSIKNTAGKSFKLGDMVKVGNSDYVLVGIPPQPIIFDGDKISSDNLMVLLFSVDTLEKIRRTGSVNREITRLVQETTLAARLGKITSPRPLSIHKNASNYEGILGSFLNGSQVALMKVATDIAIETLSESEGKKK